MKHADQIVGIIAWEDDQWKTFAGPPFLRHAFYKVFCYAGIPMGSPPEIPRHGDVSRIAVEYRRGVASSNPSEAIAPGLEFVGDAIGSAHDEVVA